MRYIVLAILVIIALIGGGIFGFLQHPLWGAKPEGERLARIEQSPNYRNGQFHNLVEVPMNTSDGNRWKGIYQFLFGDKSKLEANPIPTAPVKADLKSIPRDEDMILWLGHSTLYMQLSGHRILIDPVLSDYASPIWFINKAFNGSHIYEPQEFPDIDVLVLSHDHYDHLDYPTMKVLIPKAKRIVTPLGVGAHLERWGAKPEQIIEEDWNATVPINETLRIHVVPAQHFSGRFLDPNPTLWAGYVFETPKRKIYFGGDSGYGDFFKTIGVTYGPIDIAILENGQYNEDWSKIHSMPEEVAQIALDVQAKQVMSVHNSKFVLARHEWREPMERLLAASEGQSYDYATPMIGEVWNLDGEVPHNRWWK